MITATATPSEVFGQLSTGMPRVITHPRPIAPGWQGDYGETSRVLYPTEQDSLLYTDARGVVPSLMLVIFCDSDCAVHIHPKRVMNMPLGHWKVCSMRGLRMTIFRTPCDFGAGMSVLADCANPACMHYARPACTWERSVHMGASEQACCRTAV